MGQMADMAPGTRFGLKVRVASRVSSTQLTPMVVHRLLTGLAIIEDQATTNETMLSIHQGPVHAADP